MKKRRRSSDTRGYGHSAGYASLLGLAAFGLFASGCFILPREHPEPPVVTDGGPGSEAGGGRDSAEAGTPGQKDAALPDADPGAPDAGTPVDGAGDPSDGGTADVTIPPPIDGGCAMGTQRCAAAGQQVETCSPAGEWVPGAECPYVCSGAGVCSGECKPGSRQCGGTDGRTPSTCDQQGRWVAGALCPSACSNGDCSGSCVPGTRRCASEGPELCNAAGNWDRQPGCPFVCQGAGQCAGECRPGSRQCQGSTPRTCGNDGRWTAAAACRFICSGGACGGVCSPGSARCNNTTRQVCRGDASGYTDDIICRFGCRDGVCQTCQPTAETCNGRDDDCDGLIDEDLPPRPCNPSCAGNQTCRNGTWSTSSCARTDTPQSCGSSCRSCPGVSGGSPVCNGGTCGVSCPGGKLCGNRCVPNANLCDGKCDHVRCRTTCVPTGTACEAARALRLWWSVPRLDNYSAASSQGQANAQNSGYGDAGVMGYVEPRALPGTRALRCYYDATRGDNLVTTGDAPAGYAGCNLGSDGNIEGYVFTSSGPGLIPLVLWYSEERKEYHTVTTHLQSDAALLGQNYVKRGTLGYVYRDRP